MKPRLGLPQVCRALQFIVRLLGGLSAFPFEATSLRLGLVLFNSPLHCSAHTAARPAFVFLAHRPKTHTCIPQSRHYSRRKTMPPKKQVEEKKVLLGRPGNSLKSGIVCRTHLSTTRHNTLLTICVSILGWTGQCWQIDPLPSHHQMFTWQPCCKFDPTSIYFRVTNLAPHRTSLMQLLSPKKLVSSFLMPDMIGYANNTSQNQKSLPT